MFVYLSMISARSAILFLLCTQLLHTAALAQRDKAWECYWAGVSKDSTGDYAGSAKDYNRAIQYDSTLMDSYTNLAYGKGMLKDYKGEIDECNRALRIDSNNAAAYQNRCAARIALGDIDSNAGYYKMAIEDCNRALKLSPYSAIAYFNRALCWYKLKKPDQAMADLITLRELDPDFEHLKEICRAVSDEYSTEGWEDYGKKDQFKPAIAEFRKGLTIDPDNPDLWYNLGGAYYEDKQYKESQKAFAKTLQLKPDSENAMQGYDAATKKVQAISRHSHKPGKKMKKRAITPANDLGGRGDSN